MNRRYYKNLRAIVHNIKTNGWNIEGQKFLNNNPKKDFHSTILGWINHYGQVTQEGEKYQKLKNEFDLLRKGLLNRMESQKKVLKEPEKESEFESIKTLMDGIVLQEENPEKLADPLSNNDPANNHGVDSEGNKIEPNPEPEEVYSSPVVDEFGNTLFAMIPYNSTKPEHNEVVEKLMEELLKVINKYPTRSFDSIINELATHYSYAGTEANFEFLTEAWNRIAQNRPINEVSTQEAKNIFEKIFSTGGLESLGNAIQGNVSAANTETKANTPEEQEVIEDSAKAEETVVVEHNPMTSSIEHHKYQRVTGDRRYQEVGLPAGRFIGLDYKEETLGTLEDASRELNQHALALVDYRNWRVGQEVEIVPDWDLMLDPQREMVIWVNPDSRVGQGLERKVMKMPEALEYLFRDSGMKYSEITELIKDLKENGPYISQTQKTSPLQQINEKFKGNSANLYSNLGNKTESNNVRIVDNVFNNKDNKGVITAYRVDKKLGFLESFKQFNAVGNPINWQDYKPRFEGDNATIAFMDWFLGNDFKDLEQEYRQELVNNINNLKGLPIEYYKELGRPSHATALDYLINSHSQQTQTQRTLNPLLDNENFIKYIPMGVKNEYVDENGDIQNFVGTENGLTEVPKIIDRFGLSETDWFNDARVANKASVGGRRPGEPITDSETDYAEKERRIKENRKHNLNARKVAVMNGSYKTKIVKNHNVTENVIPGETGFRSILSQFGNNLQELEKHAGVGIFLNGEIVGHERNKKRVKLQINGKDVEVSDISNLKELRAQLKENSHQGKMIDGKAEGHENGQMVFIYQTGIDAKGNPIYVGNLVLNNHPDIQERAEKNFNMMFQLAKKIEDGDRELGRAFKEQFGIGFGYGNLDQIMRNYMQPVINYEVLFEFLKTEGGRTKAQRIAGIDNRPKELKTFFKKYQEEFGKDLETENYNTFMNNIMGETKYPFKKDFAIKKLLRLPQYKKLYPNAIHYKQDRDLKEMSIADHTNIPNLDAYDSFEQLERDIRDGNTQSAHPREIMYGNLHTKRVFQEIKNKDGESFYTANSQPYIMFESNLDFSDVRISDLESTNIFVDISQLF